MYTYIKFMLLLTISMEYNFGNGIIYKFEKNGLKRYTHYTTSTNLHFIRLCLVLCF